MEHPDRLRIMTARHAGKPSTDSGCRLHPKTAVGIQIVRISDHLRDALEEGGLAGQHECEAENDMQGGWGAQTYAAARKAGDRSSGTARSEGESEEGRRPVPDSSDRQAVKPGVRLRNRSVRSGPIR